jgi:hypothetical protein
VSRSKVGRSPRTGQAKITVQTGMVYAISTASLAGRKHAHPEAYSLCFGASFRLMRYANAGSASPGLPRSGNIIRESNSFLALGYARCVTIMNLTAAKALSGLEVARLSPRSNPSRYASCVDADR